MERLTMCIDSHLLDNGELDKEYSLNSKIELNDYSCMDIPNAVYNKLGELEDVLEKYGIEDLSSYIEDLQYQLIVKDKALELACKEELRGVGVYDEDYGSPEKLTTLIEDYLEQAEKELKDDKTRI